MSVRHQGKELCAAKIELRYHIDITDAGHVFRAISYRYTARILYRRGQSGWSVLIKRIDQLHSGAVINFTESRAEDCLISGSKDTFQQTVFKARRVCN